METLKKWIDLGAEICGGQNKLADRLDMSRSWLSNVRSGRMSMSRPKLVQLGELCGFDGEQLYREQRVSRLRESLERRAESIGVLCAAGAAAGVMLAMGESSQQIDLAGLFGLALVDARLFISAVYRSGQTG